MYSICTQKVLVFGTNDPSAHPPHISSCFLCHPASKRGSSNVPSSPTPGRATCGGYRCSSGPTPSSSRAPASWKLRTWSLKGALDFERCGWTILTGVKGSACFTQFLSARTSKHRTKGRERERECPNLCLIHSKSLLSHGTSSCSSFLSVRIRTAIESREVTLRTARADQRLAAEQLEPVIGRNISD